MAEEAASGAVLTEAEEEEVGAALDGAIVLWIQMLSRMMALRPLLLPGSK